MKSDWSMGPPKHFNTGRYQLKPERKEFLTKNLIIYLKTLTLNMFSVTILSKKEYYSFVNSSVLYLYQDPAAETRFSWLQLCIHRSWWDQGSSSFQNRRTVSHDNVTVSFRLLNICWWGDAEAADSIRRPEADSVFTEGARGEHVSMCLMEVTEGELKTRSWWDTLRWWSFWTLWGYHQINRKYIECSKIKWNIIKRK